MADIFSKKKRSEIMSRVLSKDSKIELEFRERLWKVEFRYRKNSAKHFGKPDLVLTKYKTVVFIDSCFWHGCEKHGSFPVTRPEFWKRKIERNRARDVEVSQHYHATGWFVIRIWEHDLNKSRRNETTEKTISLLLNNEYRTR